MSSAAPTQGPAEEDGRQPERARHGSAPRGRHDQDGQGAIARDGTHRAETGRADHPHMRVIKERRISAWRHTSALVRRCDAPEFGAHGLTPVPETMCIAHPGAKEACGRIRISVADEDCLDRARWLTEKGHTVAVLNMACASSPGGGVRWGAGAQEEELHRRTDLCRFLRDHKERPDRRADLLTL